MAIRTPGALGLSRTERNWLGALAIVVGSGLVFAAILALEQSQGLVDRKARFVWNAVETSTRYLAVAHIIVGTSFLLTSRKMQRTRSRLWFLGLLVGGTGLCWMFQLAGGISAYVPAALFYGYFLVHEFRDEAFFYRLNGDAPEQTHAPAATTLILPALFLGLVLTVFLVGGAWGIGGARRYAEGFVGTWSTGARIALGLGIALTFGATAHYILARFRRRLPDGLGAFIKQNRPLLFVFLGTFLVLFVGIALTGRLYPIVAIHVAAWYVFTQVGLGRMPASDPRPRAFTWRWVRTTRAGFNTFHLGLLALLMGLGFWWAYGTGNDSGVTPLYLVLSRDAFPFWTIMHVSVSFVPR